MRRNQAHARRKSLVRIGLVGFACAATLATTPTARAQSSKEQTYAAMIGLAQQIAELKPLAASNEAAAALMAQLQAAYKAASDSLGGDDPARLYSKRPMPAIGQTPHAPAHRGEGGIAGTTVVPPGCPAAGPIVFGGFIPALPIPDLGTVTTSFVVGGPPGVPMPGVIWYVDTIIEITHTFNADLDISLTSPSGTTVTLSTDNGGAFDDVFDGTFFGDSSNPGGTVPYPAFTNDGLVTDHLYVDLVAASPLVPEEAMSAFRGEDPNGTWTLTVTDDAGLNVGAITYRDLFVVTSPPPSNETTRTVVNPAVVPIADLSTVSSSVTVAGMGGFVCDVEARVNITHTFAADLQIALTSPSGTIVTLTSNNGGFADNVFAGTVFDDDVSPGGNGLRLTTDAVYTDLIVKATLTPEEALSTLRGEPANGVWTLTVADTLGADFGTLNSFGVTVTSCSCGPSCPGDFNGDGNVDVLDLLNVINTWGACP